MSSFPVVPLRPNSPQQNNISVIIASVICHLYNVASILMTVPSIKLMIIKFH